MMEVLQNREQIAEAREALINKRISQLEPTLLRNLKTKMRRFGVDRPSVGDWIKSWDVFKTIEFVDRHVAKEQPVLDIGCYSSEVIVALHQLGYRDLHGVDLNPNLRKMPYQQTIDYRHANFMSTGYPYNMFAAITAISVIEHGYDASKLFSEMSRVLRPGGYFIASFDYWPQRVDTRGMQFFGLDWLVFSRDDVDALLKEAAVFQLYPTGALVTDATQKAIHHAGFDYTFGWLVLEKRA